MTTYNKKKSILEKGGMMIEALAMLGLIAVVTPTMYKKSAERTLEVEDINTAAQMRTYMNAVEAYISGNYASIMADMTEHDHNQETYQVSKLTQFLPYGYATTNQLHDYGAPVISVIKEGNNLTGFLLFPANEDAENGIGRERTARIASLIGANGGYVRKKDNENYARGVGGVWRLEGGAYSAVFPEGSDVNENSIVIATANPVTGTAQGDLDNDKYLQRTKESDNQDDRWRNTMRTDLYLGGYAEKDPKNNDSESENTLHSIRNVNSLIIGAEDGEGENDGLYIADSATKKNAYIAGTLKAVAEKFVVDENNLSYAGKFFVVDKDDPDTNTHIHELSYGQDTTKGYFKVTSTGDLTQYGNVALATNFIAGNGSVSIGKENGEATEFILEATHTGGADGTTTVKMVNGDAFTLTNNSLMLMNGGDNKLPNSTISLGIADSDYVSTPTFPVQIGSNTKVDGLLTAAMIDTKHLRSTSLEVGSDQIDDVHKWLDVDGGGIKMYSTENRTDGQSSNVAIDVNDSGLSVRSGGVSDDDKAKAILKVQKNDGDGEVIAGTDSVRMQMKNSEVIFGGDKNTFDDMDENQNYRVVFGQNGNVDLVDSNLRVVRTKDDKTYNILSVAGNTKGENDFDNPYNDALVDGENASYDMAVHGNVAFTGRLEKDENKELIGYSYLSIGRAEQDSGVSIVASGDPKEQKKQVLFVDLKPYSTHDGDAYSDDPVLGDGLSYPGTNNKPTLTSGTIYIRKGMVDVMPKKPDNNKSNATSGYGVIKASRFVANNLDSEGNYVKVEKILKDGTYDQYNGNDHQNRYDTYMVNPAYTSVMHDIKLTTRGGARLSDVLPDFITKGIYVATNDYDDNLSDFTFTLEDKDTSLLLIKVGDKTPERVKRNWASPYAGSVPAPQCPPGYGRVVTVTPSNITMAEAGGITYLGDEDVGALNFRVDPKTILTNADKLQGLPGSTETEKNDAIGTYYPQYRQLRITGTGNLTLTDNANNTQTNYEAAVPEGAFEVASAMEQENNAAVSALTTLGSGGGFNPLVFQQNTKLRTAAVPVCAGGKPNTIGQSCEGYTRGWAILLGFVYSSDWYRAFTGYDNVGDDNEDVGYWNLFPVKQNTLAAYVTTYCYFNRANMGSLGKPFDTNYEQYVDPYHPVRMGVPGSFEKKAGDAYLKRLNDPTLKYNEVW